MDNNLLYEVLFEKFYLKKNESSKESRTKTSEVNISSYFSMMLEELEQIRNEQDEEKKNNFIPSNESNAFDILEKENAINSCVKLLTQAYEEWQRSGIEVAITTHGSIHPKDKLVKGKKTPERAYDIPILESLVRLGGSGTKEKVLGGVYEIMKDFLLPYDFEILESVEEERWKNTACWARNNLKERGLLKIGSKIGIWEISSDGQNYLVNNIKIF